MLKMTHNSKKSAEDDDSKREECYECVGMDIGVSVLKYLHKQQTSDDEHEGSICKVEIEFQI